MAGENSSSSRPWRSSRNAAAGKQGAPRVAAHDKQSALRVAAATNAADASDGKQTDLGVSVAASTTLHPIDLRSDVAPAEGRTEVAMFVNRFYCALNFNLLGLYLFYVADAQFLWNFNGRRLNLKTAEEIKSYLYRASSKMKFHALHYDSLSIPGENSLLLQSQNHCEICNKKWHPLDRDWVCCDRCQMWLHVECDPNCSRDMKIVQMSEYSCPGCTSVCKDVSTLKSTLKKKSLEPIIVSCAGKEGFFKPEEDMIECRCKTCLKSTTPRVMSMNLQETPDGTGITSIASEILQVSSVDASYQPAAETSDQPTAVTSDQPAASLSCAMSGNKSQKSKVCILHDYDRMKSHQDKDTDHVDEKAARLSEIMNTLKQDGVMDRTETEPFDSADYEIVLTSHDRILLDYVDNLPMTDEEQEAIFFEVAGVSLFSSVGTTEAIKSAAGAVIRGSNLVVEEYYETAFAIIRPPGHHAHRSKAEGFCFLNNIAIAAQHIINHHHKERILVVDFDVHHGNGTQGIFYQSKQVLFFSTHRKDLSYPDSDSSTDNLGEGVGFGYNINVPLRQGFDDVDMLYVCDVLLSPVATEFNPEVVLVSAGYDAAEGDDMGGCYISAKGFGTIVRKLLHLSRGKMVLALEGGYDLVQLPICVSHTIRAILGDEDAFLQDSDYRDKRVHETTISTVNTLKRNLRLCWDVFKEKHSGPSPEAQAPLPPGGLGAGPGDAGIGCSSYVTST